jgi:hypothetical protein
MPLEKKKPLAEFNFTITFDIVTNPPSLFTDNQCAVALSGDPRNYQRLKYIAVWHHNVHEVVRDNKIVIDYVPSVENPADILTKAVGLLPHENCVRMVGLKESRKVNE